MPGHSLSMLSMRPQSGVEQLHECSQWHRKAMENATSCNLGLDTTLLGNDWPHLGLFWDRD